MMPDPKAEGRRWLAQARAEHTDAQRAAAAGSHYLALFLAQQSAEKALKAYLYAQGERDVLGHSVGDLIDECIGRDERFRVVQQARRLDRYYIPTRYPNGLPGGVPAEVFSDPKESEEGIQAAGGVMELVTSLLGES